MQITLHRRAFPVKDAPVVLSFVPSAHQRHTFTVGAKVYEGECSELQVVVPDDAVTGLVRISGAPGNGLFLQITPTIRNVLAADANVNFDNPVETLRWSLFGSGLVDGGTQVTFGGIFIIDHPAGGDIDVLSVSTTPSQRDTGRLDLSVH